MAVSEVLNVVYSVMGTNPHKHNTNTGQISYNCLICDAGRNKGKLEINYKKLVMKCWSCSDQEDGLKGSLYSLVKEFGSHRDLKSFRDATKDFEFEGGERPKNYVPNIYLPKEYTKITPNRITPSMLSAYSYLKGRGISDEQILKYEIGYCDSGEYYGRVIIPSFASDGKLNFFVGRSYMGAKNKYKNPEILKNEIIANENNINWDSTVYLVEGMFDLIGIGVKNTIPLLGKTISERLLEEILEKSKGYVVVALDPEAEKDAYEIYKLLESYYQLHNRVRIIELPQGLDWAELREKYGKKGVIKCIKKMRQLTYSDYIKYSLI